MTGRVYVSGGRRGGRAMLQQSLLLQGGKWTEAQLQTHTLKLAKVRGWRSFHALPARGRDGQWRTHMAGQVGFPDWCFARAGVVLFRELKGYDARGRLGTMDDAQVDWAHALDPGWPYPEPTVMAPVFDVWTPDDWRTIQATLTLPPGKLGPLR